MAPVNLVWCYTGARQMSEPEDQEEDDYSDAEDSRPAKRIPEWAQKENLHEALRVQVKHFSTSQGNKKAV